MLSDLLFQLRSLFKRATVEMELDDELKFHFEHQVEKYMQSGLARDEAVRQARLELGGVEQVKENCRDVREVRMIETVARDVRFGLRMLGKNPVFTAIALITLALGIAANTAIFSVVNALLINPYRFPEPDRIICVDAHHISGKNQNAGYRDFLDWREQNNVFEEMAIFPEIWSGGILTGQGEPRRISGAQTTYGFLRVLGIRPVVGRFFTADEDKPGAPQVAVLSYAAWRKYFGGSQGVLGKTMTYNSYPFTIIGVLPRDFVFPGIQTCEFFTALRDNPSNNRFQHQYEVLARLKPGVSQAAAQANMNTITRVLELEYPETNSGWGVRLTPLNDSLAEVARTPVLVLFSVVFIVLLMACANVAGLQLARASARAREMAVRASLGAGRRRIASQVLTESLLLSLGGGALGLLFARWFITVLCTIAPAEAALDAALSLDRRVLLFTLVLSIFTGLAFGAAPAIYGSGSDLNSVIKGDAGVGSHNRRGGRFMSCLIAGEVALSLILLVGAGLLVKDLMLALRVPTGMNTKNVLTFELDAPPSKYDSIQARMSLYQDVLNRLNRASGVEATATVSSLPMTQGYTGGLFQVEGRDKIADHVNKEGNYDPSYLGNSVQYNDATPGFFSILGIPFLQGRNFDERDTVNSQPVSIINDVLRKQYFPNENPIGRKFLDAYEGRWRTIVGVTGSYKQRHPMKAPGPVVFRPFSQVRFGYPWIAVRTSGDSQKIAGSIEGIMRSIDPDVFVLKLRPMRQVVADSLSQSQVIAQLLTGFAGFALLLATVGIYGIVAYSVRQRLHEMGIRMALGASSADILGLVLRKGARLSVIGVIIGIPVALCVCRVLSAWLLGITPYDFSVFVLISAGLILISLAASYFPARHATKVDPIGVLRTE